MSLINPILSKFARNAAGQFLLATCIAMVCASGCDKPADAAGKKTYKHPRICILGCDGMDPKLVRRMINEGRLPNLAQLEKEGGFKPLETSIPPQSPVAWSNFITGAGPGVHGIFDFIHRDPEKQAAPYFSTNRIHGGEDVKPIEIGDYQVPKDMIFPWVASAENELLRRGTPFWDFLDERGIPVQMYKLPANYPPSESKHDHMCCLAGMGVPDAFGSQGTFQHFSTKPRREVKSAEGYRLRLSQTEARGEFSGKIYGPANEFKDKNPPMTAKLKVYVDPDRDVAKLAYVNLGLAGEETKEIILNVGEWRRWEEIHFLKTPFGPSMAVMARFLLHNVRPDVEIYMTPLNFIPTNSPVPVSEPPEFAAEIGEAIGPYHTQGFAEAFNARKQLMMTDEEYRIQSHEILEESVEMMDYALDRFEDGVLFFYYSSTDLQAHIFWWDSDEKHPVRTSEDAKKYMQVVESVYERMDAALGKCRRKLGDDVTFIVMSDHGFCNFKRCVGLNTWLQKEGYLSAKRNLIADADWAKTRAYGLGLNGLYLNLEDREKMGIVEPKDRDALLEEISEKLLALKDPITGQQVIRRVYRADQWYKGPEAAKAPDLLIGYERGYRASWNTCLGEFDSEVIFDNDNAWSADHCIAHDVVPGVVLSNRPIVAENPALIDLAPTILAEFGVQKPEQMTGSNIFDSNRGRIAAK